MPDSPPSPAIEVKDLVKTYAGMTAVDRVTFTVERGEIVGFLGPNGAGKSTTMRILTGFLPANAGHAFICGVPVASRPDEIKRLIGYMPENNPLPEDMRVTEYLHFRGRLKEIPRSRLSARVEELLELCDLKRFRHRIIGKLSKGTRQRVGIAEALLAEPPVVIMDEPTIGLDPHQILIVRDLIQRLRGKMAVVISSHILPEIEMTCDRVVIINQGRVVAAGRPDDLRREVAQNASYLVETAAAPDEVLAAARTVDPAFNLLRSAEPGADGCRTVTLSVPGDSELGERLLPAFAAAGVRLRALARSRPTLEDVFLAATRRTWDITDAPPPSP